MNIYLKLKNDVKADVESKYLHTSLALWKEAVLDNSQNIGRIYWHKDENSGPLQVYLKANPKFPGISPANNQMILVQTGELVCVPSFMAFTIEDYFPQSLKSIEGSVTERYDALGRSFAHNLTKVGQRTFERIKKCIADRFSKSNTYAASIASICQHSGS